MELGLGKFRLQNAEKEWGFATGESGLAWKLIKQGLDCNARWYDYYAIDTHNELLGSFIATWILVLQSWILKSLLQVW